MNNNDNFWVEKYRPKSLNDIVLTEENSRIINKFISDTEIPNILLYGNPGTVRPL
jgi:replication-associated recombination protein RarA